MIDWGQESSQDAIISKLKNIADRQYTYDHSIINLIASDNASPLDYSRLDCYDTISVQEGNAGQRPFAGAVLHDEVEAYVRQVACIAFGAEHANIQPHSCSQANEAVYSAFLEPGDRVLALSYLSGGHLTHGMRMNFSGRNYEFHHFKLGANEQIDYGQVATMATRLHPKLIMCGASAYPRCYRYEALRAAADSVGARLVFDISHEAGLILGGAFPSPVGCADAVTLSMDKTLRGRHGGMILARKADAKRIDHAVHPGVQSSFAVRKLYDAGLALAQATTSEFREYASRTVAMARRCADLANMVAPGCVVAGGTDKHYLIIDVFKAFNMMGTEAERLLEQAGVLSNRQATPRDSTSKIRDARGVRLGFAWMASRGFSVADLDILFPAINECLSSRDVSGLSRAVTTLLRLKRPLDVWENAPSQHY